MFDLEFHYDCNWGEIERIDDYFIYITKETWAPGLWAGTEGLRIVYGIQGYSYCILTTVLKVDLDNRCIQVANYPDHAKPPKPLVIYPAKYWEKLVNERS